MTNKQISLRPFEVGNESFFSKWFENDQLGMKFLDSYAKPSGWIHLINNVDRFLYIAYDAEKPVGFFDFEIKGEVGHFVVYIETQSRGKGVSKEIIREAFQLQVVGQVDILDVNVEKDNVRSIELLNWAGFSQEGSDEDGMLIYKKHKPFQLS